MKKIIKAKKAPKSSKKPKKAKKIAKMKAKTPVIIKEEKSELTVAIEESRQAVRQELKKEENLEGAYVPVQPVLKPVFEHATPVQEKVYLQNIFFEISGMRRTLEKMKKDLERMEDSLREKV